MAIGESTASVGPFGALTPSLVAKLGEQAFHVAAHMMLSQAKPGDTFSPECFAEDVSQAFEALLQCRAERDGFGFLAQGYGAWAEDWLGKVPQGFRPMYEAGRLNRERVKLEARRLAKKPLPKVRASSDRDAKLALEEARKRALKAGEVVAAARATTVDPLAQVASAWCSGDAS